MNTYKIGFKESDTIERCLIDYIYTANGGEYTLASDTTAIDISHCVNTLHCLETIMCHIKNVYRNGTPICVEVTLTEEAEQGIDTDLNDSFFFGEADENIETFAREFMFIDRGNYAKEDDFFKTVETLWNKWNTEVRLHIWNEWKLRNLR